MGLKVFFSDGAFLFKVFSGFALVDTILPDVAIVFVLGISIARLGELDLNAVLFLQGAPVDRGSWWSSLDVKGLHPIAQGVAATKSIFSVISIFIGDSFLVTLSDSESVLSKWCQVVNNHRVDIVGSSAVPLDIDRISV